MTRVIRVRAFAKINLTLRVLGARSDEYHELRTVFQSIALHDVITFVSARGPFEIECDDPQCPVDRRNLVWQAALGVWRAARRSGAPRGLRVRIDKRIPMEAGLGGGSADAAAALRALAALWRPRLSDGQLCEIGATLGADVPFCMRGGTILGVNRGDVLFPLNDLPDHWIVLALPDYGVSTKEAYAWFDERARPLAASARENMKRATARRKGREPERLALHLPEVGNDLQAAVINRHPEIGRLIAALDRAGAAYAAMSGSGSGVFGLFDTRKRALAAADTLVHRRRRVIVTRMISAAEHHRLGAPRLARK